MQDRTATVSGEGLASVSVSGLSLVYDKHDKRPVLTKTVLALLSRVLTGSPGGSLLVGFKGTKHPQEVAKLMDYLTQADVLGEFSIKSSFLPGHLGLAKQGLKFTNNAEILNQLSLEIPKINEQAYKLQYSKYAFTYNRPIDGRLAQVIAGELSLDDAIKAIQKDVDDAIAAAKTS